MFQYPDGHSDMLSSSNILNIVITYLLMCNVLWFSVFEITVGTGQTDGQTGVARNATS